MAVLFSSLSALVMGTASAAKAVATEIIPPAAALVGDIVATAIATAWPSVAWFISCLRAAVAVAIDTLPHAVAAARTAAWSAVQASRPFVGVALQLLSHLWRLSSAAVRLATATLPAAVASVESLVGAACSLLATAAAVAVHALSYAVAAAESAVRASQPWLELSMISTGGCSPWLPTKVRTWSRPSRTRRSRPFEPRSHGWTWCPTSCINSTGGWTRWQSRSFRACRKRSRTWRSPRFKPASHGWMHAFHGWLVIVAAEGSPDVVQAAKNAAFAAAEVSQPWLDMVTKLSHNLYGWLVATAAEKLKTDAANACVSSASEKLISSAGAGAPAVVSPVDSTPSQEILHEWSWSWFLHDRGVVVYAYVLLALALLAVAFICGGVCALTLRSRLADREDHGDRRRSHPHQRQRAA